MDRLHNLIGRHNDYGATLNAVAFTFPMIPETSEGEDLAILHANVVRNFIALHLFPLVEAVSRYQATLTLEGGAIGGFLCYRLDTGVDSRVFGLELH